MRQENSTSAANSRLDNHIGGGNNMKIYRIYEWSNRNGEEANIYYVSAIEKANSKVAELESYYNMQGYKDDEYHVAVDEYTIDEMMAEDGDLVGMELDADKPDYIDVEILDIVRENYGRIQHFQNDKTSEAGAITD
jgi:cellobiose phosphorylase